jgi:LmbE family N-acetylglucosaminyl deacetylase
VRDDRRVLADTQVERALVIVAHPDDAEFWAGGTIAAWSDAGITTTYLILTDGDAGGVDQTPRADIPRIRRTEQRAAANILGVSDVQFLGWAEGTIAQSPQARAELVRVIRQVRPQRLMTWSPEWAWDRFRTSCHVDHRTTGELALTATYPDAGNPFAHPHLLDEHLEPWTVAEIWLLNAPTPTHHVEVTDQFDRKIRALRAHASQTGHRPDLPDEVKQKLAPFAAAAGLAPDRIVDAFQVVMNR